MWLPPTWLIYCLVSGGGRSPARMTVEAPGQTTKVVCCEACGRCYTFELKRIGVGADAARAAENLKEKLAVGIEAIPCPACGWYQSDMIPDARKLHRRWMFDVGLCLTVGLIPVAFIGLLINTDNGKHPALDNVDNTPPPIPWPIFLAGLVCSLALGIGMFIGRYMLAQRYEPNDEEEEARKRYGQSRAILLSEQEPADVLSRPVVRRPTGLTDRGALLWCIFGVICVAGLVGCGGFFGVRSAIRSHVAARFEKNLLAYIALLSAAPPKCVEQPRLPQPGGDTGKIKGKMVVINGGERKIDDLYFALPDDLRASGPAEVATVVLLTWEKRQISGNGPISADFSVEYQMSCQVRVFDWENKSEFASHTFFGDCPSGGGFRSDTPSVTGPKPDEAEMLTFLTRLPRQ